ncbi:hypothetical protein E3N88_44827 [Mikania micrantha]|uniref:Homeobox-leucine zipper protein n=1 Tax=Mikania micrantha TaxID=192012 RepID=A0A5N6LD70_9ASTR|nr:hypothetical protein E3N88_44827 [Mikania micrantha]
MDWNDHVNPRPFIPRPAAQSSFAFLYNYNNDHYVYPPGIEEMKHQMMQAPLAMMEMNQNEYDNNNQDKKKRLTSEQLEALENTFQEEKKLDPDTKMKLAHELGLQPRQIAVLALRSILKEQVSKRQGAGSSTGYTYMSGEETVRARRQPPYAPPMTTTASCRLVNIRPWVLLTATV